MDYRNRMFIRGGRTPHVTRQLYFSLLLAGNLHQTEWCLKTPKSFMKSVRAACSRINAYVESNLRFELVRTGREGKSAQSRIKKGMGAHLHPASPCSFTDGLAFQSQRYLVKVIFSHSDICQLCAH